MRISIIAIFYEMRREAARTLYTLSSAYQRHAGQIDYEVIAIDNGSTTAPLSREFVHNFGANFGYERHVPTTPSPAQPCNYWAARASGDVVMVLIDGARMLSPGFLYYTARAMAAFENPFVYSIGMHLGPKVQNLSMLEGYNQAAEDRLLDSVDWRENGYRLFDISSVALSSKHGFFSDVAESNCFAMKRDTFLDMGGFDERFTSPGGGLVNLDFYNRAVGDDGIEPVKLLGEASFHQFHGGTATNVPMAQHPWSGFAEEYRSIRGCDYAEIIREPHYIGHVPVECRRFIGQTSAGGQ